MSNEERFNKEFERWHRRVLMMSIEYGSNAPVGTCLQRDVIRDAKVKDAMKEAYWEIIYKDNCPIQRTKKYREENGRYEITSES